MTRNYLNKCMNGTWNKKLKKKMDDKSDISDLKDNYY